MTKFLKNKMKLDEYLVENEYFENLEIAKRQIMVCLLYTSDAADD